MLLKLFYSNAIKVIIKNAYIILINKVIITVMKNFFKMKKF